MKKRTFTLTALLCAFCCTFGLVACDNDGTDNEGEADNKTQIGTGTGSNTGSETEGGVKLTESTDVSALVSDKVADAEWRAAFSENAFSNATIKEVSENDTSYWSAQTNGTDRYVQLWGDQGNGDGNAFYEEYFTLENGNLYCYIYRYENSDGWVRGTLPPDPEFAYDSYQLSFILKCPDFSGFFSEFTYDEATSAYIYEGESVMTNSIMESWDVIYDYASVKIVGGKIAYISCGFSKMARSANSNNNIELYFYDYGTTAVTPPTEFTEYEEKN